MRRKINKVAKKHCDGKCYFCDESNYALLDVHRIIPGDSGPGYTHHNSVTCCANCHRKIHADIIKIDRKYFSSSGKWILHYWKEDQEYWR